MNIMSVVVKANGAFLQMVGLQDQVPHLRESRAGARRRKDDGGGRSMALSIRTTHGERRSVRFSPSCGGVGTMCPLGVCSPSKTSETFVQLVPKR